MSVKNKDIVITGSAVMPEDEVTEQIGGAEDRTRKMSFANLVAAGDWEAVSSHASDTMNVTLYGHLSTGDDANDVKALNGQTPVAFDGTWHCALKAVKAAGSANGDIAVMAQTNTHSGTAQGGGVDYIDLDATASDVEGTYDHMVIRPTNNTPAGIQYSLREIIWYQGGTNRRAWVNKDWAYTPTAATTYEIAVGMVFDLGPGALEFEEVRSIFMNVAAEQEGGSEVIVYEKVFAHNKSATTLTKAKIAEVDEGAYALCDFDLESSLDGTDDNGAGNNRAVAPGGYTFNSDQKDVPNSGNLTGGSSVGIWIKATIPAGTAGQKTFWKPSLTGQSIG